MGCPAAVKWHSNIASVLFSRRDQNAGWPQICSSCMWAFHYQSAGSHKLWRANRTQSSPRDRLQDATVECLPVRAQSLPVRLSRAITWKAKRPGEEITPFPVTLNSAHPEQALRRLCIAHSRRIDLNKRVCVCVPDVVGVSRWPHVWLSVVTRKTLQPQNMKLCLLFVTQLLRHDKEQPP